MLRLPFGRRSPFGARAVDEVRLLHEAAQAYPDLTYADLTHPALVEITAARGVDFATALFYDRIRRSPEHGPFIARTESLDLDPASRPQMRGRALVAPAAFYAQFPSSGGDGLLVRDVAAEFGLRTGVLPVSPTGTVTENAAVVGEALAAEPDGSVVLISLSKGGADVRMALEMDPGLAGKLRAWVQICGLVHGSPAADEVLDASPLRRLLTRISLAAIGGGYGGLAELRHAPGARLARPFTPPPGLLVLNVVACPLSSHLSPTVRARHGRLSALGPNDGSTPLRDAIVEPGLVYPVWSADHYFRIPQGARLLYQLFTYLAGTTPEPAEPALATTIAGHPPGPPTTNGATGHLPPDSPRSVLATPRIPISNPAEYAVPARIQSWYLVAASAAVPGGTVRSVDFLGQPLVLFRTESGRLGAVAAHCWHMGTHLGAGRVVGEHIQCPLHCWEFDGQGICRRTPAGRPPRGAHQMAFPVAERFGGIFVFNGPRALFPPPAFDLAPERELSFGSGKPVRLRCPWYALASNGFDVQHLQTVHARQLRQPAVVDRTTPHRLRLRYVSRVVGNGPSDRLVRWLSGNRVQVSITCWGGSIVLVESRLAAMRSVFLASCAPLGDGTASEISFIVGVKRKPVTLLNRLHVLASRILFTRFLQRDARVLQGMRFRPQLPLPEGEPMLQYLRFLHDLPPAVGAWGQDDDRSSVLAGIPASGRSTAAPLAGQSPRTAPAAGRARS